jgi:hypothetical protein
MKELEILIAKHGEHGVQALLENWERFCGIRHDEPMSLEHRWEIFMRSPSSQNPLAA